MLGFLNPTYRDFNYLFSVKT